MNLFVLHSLTVSLTHGIPILLFAIKSFKITVKDLLLCSKNYVYTAFVYIVNIPFVVLDLGYTKKQVRSTK